MLVRVEMASLIQDILRQYNEIEGVKHEKSRQLIPLTVNSKHFKKQLKD